MAISEEKLAELAATHRRVKHIKVGDLEFVIRAPKRHEFKIFRSKAFNEEARSNAQEDFVRLLVVEPSREAFDAVLEDYPGLTDAPAVTLAIRALTGQVADEEGKASGSSANGSAGAQKPSPMV